MGSNNDGEISSVSARSKEDEPKANTFLIPPHIIAEAMSSIHENLDLRWSGPITPTEMRYVEQYVQARYPEYYGGLIGAVEKDSLPPGFTIQKEDGENSERRSPRFGSAGNREFSPSFGRAAPTDFKKTQLEENSHLQEMLKKRACSPDTSVSVPEMHARNRVLKQCGVSEDDYIVVFASEVNEAMKLVGQSYPFLRYMLYMSVLEEEVECIKEFATYKEAKVIQAPPSWLDLRIAGSQLSQHFRRKTKHTPKGLFAYPAVLGGTRNSLHWVSEAQRNLWHVLLDCTGLTLGEDELNLTLHKPDFVLCILPKAPQHATKVTCLLIRKSSFVIACS